MPSPDPFRTDIPLTCARCGRGLRPGTGDCYRVRAEAVSDPAPPDVSEDLKRDLRPEIEALLQQAAGMSEEELLAGVYRRLTFWLCTACYRVWVENPAGAS